MELDTNPEGSVEDADASINDRMLSLLGTDDGQPREEDEDATEEVAEDQSEEASEEPEGSEESDEGEEAPDAEADEDQEQPEDDKAKLEEERLGYMREADYRRKTQEVAEQRRAVEAERAEVAKERERYAQSLEYLQQQIPQPQVPDTELLESDPVEYLRQKSAYDAAMQQHQSVSMERQRIHQQMQAEQAQQRERLLAEQSQRVVERIPEWADPEKREALTKDVRSYMDAHGFSEEEMGGMVMAHHLETVVKAAKYDKLMAQKPKVEKKVRDAPKVVKPGTATNRDSKDEVRAKTRQKLRKTGRVEDAAAAILSLNS